MNEEASTSNLIRGCWQLAAGHSQQNADLQPIMDAIACGFTTFDCADIYCGVEELLGRASQEVPEIRLRIHTKCVPDLNCLHEVNYEYIERIIDRSLRRLRVDCLDLVQFHWWNFEIKNYLYALEFLSKLKDKGKIAEIGLTNVNGKYLEQILKNFNIAALQVQISPFDRRVERGVGELCRKNHVKLLAYGSLLGGFISEKWLGNEEPVLETLSNRSLIKYKLLIDAACGWTEFQRRLSIINALAVKYRTDIANIVIAALLQSGRADSVIVGLSPRNYAGQNRSLMQFPILEAKDLQEISTWPCNLFGDVYDEERDVDGAHAKVMKYNLNAELTP